MYIPTGHAVCERTGSATMIYGTRKSYIFTEPSAPPMYLNCVQMLTADGKDVKRMEQVHGALKTAIAAQKKP